MKLTERHLRNIIRESLSEILREAADDTFSLQELSNLPSFNAKVKYCKQHLGSQIGNGSARIVFQIDDEKCLKLAKNQKGIAQNGVENDWYKQKMDCFPKIFEVDQDNQWIVTEYVLPAKPNDFKQCLGITMDEFFKFMTTCYKRYARGFLPRAAYDWNTFYEMIDNNKDLNTFNRYMCDYQPPIGDMLRISSYGLALRHNQPAIVILDHGLSYEVYNTYYR